MEMLLIVRIRREAVVTWFQVAYVPSKTCRAAHFGGWRGFLCDAPEKRMSTGIVKWFNSQKVLGFIQPDGGGNDVFVHISAVQRAGLHGLGEGQKVSFEAKTDKVRGKVSAENLSLR